MPFIYMVKNEERYAESFRLLGKCVAKLPNYIEKYFSYGIANPSIKTDRLVEIGKCLLAGCDSARTSKPIDRDRAVFMNFVYNICRFADGFPGHHRVVEFSALRFLSDASSLERASCKESSLFNFMVEHAGQQGYTYYSLGEKMISAQQKLRKNLPRYKNIRNMASIGAEILLENLAD